jgi:hypothetical protein
MRKAGKQEWREEAEDGGWRIEDAFRGGEKGEEVAAAILRSLSYEGQEVAERMRRGGGGQEGEGLAMNRILNH